MKVSYKWLQSFFEENTLPSADKVADTLLMHSFEIESVEKINEDVVIDVDVLPNRAHDCLSHQGIAKEVSVLLDIPLKRDRYFLKSEIKNNDEKMMVSIENDRCRRYMGCIVNNIEIKESPKWLQDLLEAVGGRSINNIVDATNFVMFDLGNPVHAFDKDKINGGISVRLGEKGESIKTVGRTEVNIDIDDSMLLIADRNGPMAMAGIKGGIRASVSDKTTSLIVEVANFEPISTRKTRQKIGIQTDSSKRFENDLPQGIAPNALDSVLKLIIEIAGTSETTVGEIFDYYPKKIENRIVSLSFTKTNSLIGINGLVFVSVLLFCLFKSN